MVIKQENRDRVIANPNVVVLYNKNLGYHREKISEWGDRCDFLDVDSSVLVDSISRFDPSVAERPEQPFDFSSTAVSNEIVIHQREIFQSLQPGFGISALAMEESLLRIVDRVIESFCCRIGKKLATANSQLIKKQREMVYGCKLFLSKRYGERITVSEISDSVGVSPSHLCRVFRQQTNETIHQYLTKLRLRTSLERVRYEHDLTQVALDLGFSSHSHFSAAFRRAFGTSPSGWRRGCGGKA